MDFSFDQDPEEFDTSDDNTPRVCPLFPLSDLILFPGQVIPLHVFEPRYRQMTQDLLDNSGEIILGTVLGEDREKLEKVAPVQPIAGLGRVQRYQALEDGRFLIMVLGERRVKIEPVDRGKIYPEARFEVFEETDSYISDTELDHLQSALKKIESQIDLPEETSPDQLVDLLIMISKIDPKDKYKIFQMTSVSDRLGKILDFH
ncbi:MAG: LON peptidase substrate-binding domain-containing protein [Planctomycetota bacterium]|nr:LON peptidase substrate-binding domain-containing protein [Planctomycetota bacterium]MDG2084168.1 LON peptidase substrate-binding domain-containing protein [Planctomycetota bacterium]